MHKSASHRDAVLDVPREIWRRGLLEIYRLLFFFPSQIVSFALSESLSPNLAAFVSQRRNRSRSEARRDIVKLCECIYKRCTQIIFARTLLPEIARVFSTTSIPAGAINSVIGSRSRTDFRNNIRTFSDYCVLAECVLTKNNRYRKETLKKANRWVNVYAFNDICMSIASPIS